MIRRNTNQRQIVIDSLVCLGHATSDDLINYINNNYSNISLATIYRNLNILLDEKQIKKISVAGNDIYEVVKEKHYHFKCLMCNNIIDVPESIIDLKVNGVNYNEIKTNSILDCEIIFIGVCGNCKANNKTNK